MDDVLFAFTTEQPFGFKSFWIGSQAEEHDATQTVKGFQIELNFQGRLAIDKTECLTINTSFQ